jgi:prevent-host-death family protein
MVEVTVEEAETQLSTLLDRAAAGEEVVITRNGRPVARLVSAKRSCSPRRLGALRGKITVPDDFDAPLPDDLLDAFETWK